MFCQVLPVEHRVRLPDKDDDVRDDIIGAAKMFFNDIMKTKGRRTDVNSTAFWAVASALIPSDVLENRKGRAIMRLLDIDYRVLKKAAEIRAGLVDGSKTWKNFTTAKHCDTADWQLISEWLHSEEASMEDNDHKELVRIVLKVDEKGPIEYMFHRARVLKDTKLGLLEAFLKSSTCVRMRTLFQEKKVAVRRRSAVNLARLAIRERGEVTTYYDVHFKSLCS